LNPAKMHVLSDPSTTPHPDHYYNGSLKGWSQFQKSASFKNNRDVTWRNHVCGFPHPGTYSPEYNAWRNAIKGKMEEDRIPGSKQSTAGQWAAIQEHALTLSPVCQRSGLWQANNTRGECPTKCPNPPPNDTAKTHQGTPRDMSRAPVAAFPLADTIPARTDRRLSPTVGNKDVPYM